MQKELIKFAFNDDVIPEVIVKNNDENINDDVLNAERVSVSALYQNGAIEITS